MRSVAVGLVAFWVALPARAETGEATPLGARDETPPAGRQGGLRPAGEAAGSGGEPSASQGHSGPGETGGPQARRPSRVEAAAGRPAAGAGSARKEASRGRETRPGRKQETGKTVRPQGFAFGSYGRVGAATDGTGSSAKPMNVVSHGTRLEESPYTELDFYYLLRPGGGELEFQTHATLALTDALFHYTGDWSSMLAIRNLYLEVRNLFVPGLKVWVGSRQYRGDDIYLLDFWPLDNLNTVGGGVVYHWRGLRAALHGGVNRLLSEYQYQVAEVPGPNNTSEEVVLLDRQRFIASAKVSWRYGGTGSRVGLKVCGYAEVHAVGSGTYNAHLEPEKQKELPADQGWLVGVQFGLWNFGQRATHLNLFLRYAQGLAAYGEMAVPWGTAPDLTASRARELLVALSGNYEYGRFGVLVGGYLRYFRDADGNTYDWDDGWEYILAARPQVFVWRHFAQAAEVSFQGRWPFGLNPRTDAPDRPWMVKLSLLPTVVFGKGTYDRPQLRFVYTLAILNAAARHLYNELDPRRTRTVQHYIGVQAEWWFNSSYR